MKLIARRNSLGWYVYPRRGQPPDSNAHKAEGYEQDPSDPFIFKPIEVPCQFREMRTKHCPSRNTIKHIPTCQHPILITLQVGLIEVTPARCMSCEHREKGD